MNFPQGMNGMNMGQGFPQPGMQGMPMPQGMPGMGFPQQGFNVSATNLYGANTPTYDQNGFEFASRSRTASVNSNAMNGANSATNMSMALISAQVGNTMLTNNQNMPGAKKRLVLPKHLYINELSSLTQMEKKLSAGGSGAVFIAKAPNGIPGTQIGPGGKVAVKLLERQNMKEDVFEDVMEQEVAITWYFNDHPNFVKIYAFANTPKAVVMKLYNGGSLRGMVYDNSITPNDYYDRLGPIFVDVAGALKDFHSNGFLHFDIKPDNVLLEKSKGPKGEDVFVGSICDMGVSCIYDHTLHPGTKAFKMSSIRGLSSFYAPPELIHAVTTKAQTTGTIGYPVDIYSFGMMMFECIVRRPPQIRSKPNDNNKEIIKGRRPRVPDKLMQVLLPREKAYLQVVFQCWHQDPAQRPTAEAAQKFLQSTIQNLSLASS